MNRETTAQFLKFTLVGALNTAVDLAVLNGLILLTQRGRTGSLYVCFKAISFLAAVLHSYVINCKWTFRVGVRQRNWRSQGTRFLAISIGGAFINIFVATVVAVFIQPVPVLRPLWPSIGALAGSGFGLFWNFCLYRCFVFPPRAIAPAGSTAAADRGFS
jgi:putative flippase GtrA